MTDSIIVDGGGAAAPPSSSGRVRVPPLLPEHIGNSPAAPDVARDSRRVARRLTHPTTALRELSQRAFRSMNAAPTHGNPGNYGCRMPDGTLFFVKLVAHIVPPWWYVIPRDQRNSAATMVPIEIAIMHAIRNNIILAGISPHFSEIIADVTINGISAHIEDVNACAEQLTKPRDRAPLGVQGRLCEFANSVRERRALDHVSLIITEYCEISIHDLFTRHAPLFESERETMAIAAMFQIFYTLWATTRIWPRFQHGDLHLDNIRICSRQSELPRGGGGGTYYLRYRYGDRVSNVPFAGYYVKIADFNIASIPEESLIAPDARQDINAIPRIRDHIHVTLNMERMLRGCNTWTPRIEAMFRSLKTTRLTPAARPKVIEDSAAQFVTPAEALFDSGAFNCFSGEVPDDRVLHEYTAPVDA